MQNQPQPVLTPPDDSSDHARTALEVRDLRVGFGAGTAIVDGVDITLRRGRILCLVGESGSGKSLTALSLMRLLQPSARLSCSSFLLDDDDIADASEDVLNAIRGNRMAMVFQEPMTALNPVMTVGRQIAEVQVLHKGIGWNEAGEKAVSMLEAVGINSPRERAASYPHQLSGGMRQRAMIAMALACEPALLIADEPTTALDVTIQAQILELMKALALRLNVALIIITHNLGVVARYASRVNVMYAGRIVEAGSADAIYHNPRHPYTIALLRSVPRLDRPRQARLDPVDGQPPDLTRLDGGCAFRPRCRFAVDRCAQEQPSLERAGEAGHVAACFRSAELVSAQDAAA